MLSRVFLYELCACNNLTNCLHNPPSLFVGAAGAESGNRRDSGPDNTGIIATNGILKKKKSVCHF